MRYVLALTSKADVAGFDRQTHNLVDDSDGDTGKWMVITEKGMMSSPDLHGTSGDRLSQLGGVVFDNSEKLAEYLRNFKKNK